MKAKNKKFFGIDLITHTTRCSHPMSFSASVPSSPSPSLHTPPPLSDGSIDSLCTLCVCVCVRPLGCSSTHTFMVLQVDEVDKCVSFPSLKKKYVRTHNAIEMYAKQRQNLCHRNKDISMTTYFSSAPKKKKKTRKRKRKQQISGRVVRFVRVFRPSSVAANTHTHTHIRP